MLEYLVDDKVRDMIRLAVGLYKYSQRLDGLLEQSLYWTSLSFEHIIRRTYGKDFEGKDLKDIIIDLCDSPKVKFSERENLHKNLNKLKTIRNKMFHTGNLDFIVYRQASEMLDDVCRMGGCDFRKILREITYEQVRQLRDKVFKIPRYLPDEKILPQPDICESDFDDLEVLYEKCEFLHFRKLKPFLSPLHLEPEEISELIPTTGAIWLPWILGHVGGRRHVKTIVLEARFTPSNVRIGIDFGSEAYEAKATYYNFLSVGKLSGHLTELARKNFLFYDTYWYFNVRNVRPIKDCYPLRIEEMRSIIDSALLEIERKKHERILMKGHQLLVGKIFSRGSEEFNRFLVKIPETIKGIFCDLLPIVNSVERSSKMHA